MVLIFIQFLGFLGFPFLLRFIIMVPCKGKCRQNTLPFALSVPVTTRKTHLYLVVKRNLNSLKYKGFFLVKRSLQQ